MIAKNQPMGNPCRSTQFARRAIVESGEAANRTPRTHSTRFPWLLLIVVMLNLSLAIQGWAFEVKTHEQLTEQAITTVESTLNTYSGRQLRPGRRLECFS